MLHVNETGYSSGYVGLGARVRPSPTKYRSTKLWYGFLFLEFIDKSTTATDFEVCVQWFQPELERVLLEDPEDTQTQQPALFLIYAFNNKALNLTSNPVYSTVKAGLCHVTEARAQTFHEKLMATLEIAENDLAPNPQPSQTAVGTTEQNTKGELNESYHFSSAKNKQEHSENC